MQHTAYLVRMNSRPVEEKVVRLLQEIKKYPEIYQSDQRAPKSSTGRLSKQKAWDQIAKNSGFAKTEEAKCRWRGLLIYFRQLLEDIARKKVRRYIPNTGNPDDKFVQLSDWRYYEYIKFMEPHVHIAMNQPNPRAKTTSESRRPNNNPATVCPVERVPILNFPEVQLTTTRSAAVPSQQSSSLLSSSSLSQQKHPQHQQSITGSHAENKFIHRKVKVGNVIVDIKINEANKQANVSLQSEHGTTTRTLPIRTATPTTTTRTLPIRTAIPTTTTTTTRTTTELRDFCEHGTTTRTPPVRTATTTTTTTELRGDPSAAERREVPTKFEDLSICDQNLKSFFDAMLRSTQRLHPYHQERVKKKLLHVVRKKD